jgi:hypothetical protein
VNVLKTVSKLQEIALEVGPCYFNIGVIPRGYRAMGGRK